MILCYFFAERKWLQQPPLLCFPDHISSSPPCWEPPAQPYCKAKWENDLAEKPPCSQLCVVAFFFLMDQIPKTINYTANTTAWPAQRKHAAWEKFCIAAAQAVGAWTRYWVTEETSRVSNREEAPRKRTEKMAIPSPTNRKKQRKENPPPSTANRYLTNITTTEVYLGQHAFTPSPSTLKHC